MVSRDICTYIYIYIHTKCIFTYTCIICIYIYICIHIFIIGFWGMADGLGLWLAFDERSLFRVQGLVSRNRADRLGAQTSPCEPLSPSQAIARGFRV